MPEPRQNLHPLAQLVFSSRVRKRAQYEAFEFSLEPRGVRVRNGSYADPENHEYLVQVHAGLPVRCTCPADAAFDGACKHRVAVAMRPLILDAVHRMQAVTDGGRPAAERGRLDSNPSVQSSHHDTGDCELSPHNENEHSIETKPENPCECDDLLDVLPCWECFRRAPE